MSPVAEALATVKAQIAAAAVRAGRPPDAARLLAVSKMATPEAILAAYAAGQRAFGENRLPLLETKRATLPKDIEWHFIGHLQRNKAARAVELADWIHSVDSVRLLERLDFLAGELNRRPVILLEFNLGGEAAKSGAPAEAAAELTAAARAARHLEFRGFMTMAPLCDDAAVWRRIFRALADLRTRYGGVELSMGMSGDFEVAVAEGATIVRIGTAIFGTPGAV